MAELYCSVKNCTYNDEYCCCKGDICIGGEHAMTTSDTCCESFSQKREGSYTSSLSHKSPTVSIDCEAVKCAYNEDCRCTADHVDICGCDACDCRETACETFLNQ